MKNLSQTIEKELRERGFSHIPAPLAQEEYTSLAASLGKIVGSELIALRPGAHAYVAKHGKVPLHTDQPQVDVISWRCERQDEQDGRSLLLDTRPIVASLSEKQRELLRSVELWCPLLSGGPPVLRFPVLTPTPEGEAVFCSPWLRAASDGQTHQEALDAFRQLISEAAKNSTTEVRLSPGEALFVDNRRVLHGRKAIGEQSQRRLHRLWVARPKQNRGHER
jgi:hypothetical protein